MQESLLGQGMELMLYGMGTVLLFLTLLVMATAAMSRLLSRYFPERLAQPAPARAAGAGEGESAETARRRMAAIAAAIHCYRSTRH